MENILSQTGSEMIRIKSFVFIAMDIFHINVLYSLYDIFLKSATEQYVRPYRKSNKLILNNIVYWSYGKQSEFGCNMIRPFNKK